MVGGRRGELSTERERRSHLAPFGAKASLDRSPALSASLFGEKRRYASPPTVSASGGTAAVRAATSAFLRTTGLGDLSPVLQPWKNGGSRAKLPFVKALKSEHSSPSLAWRFYLASCHAIT